MSGLINYTRVNFKDYPEKETPLTASNLNVLDKGIYDLDQAINEIADDMQESSSDSLNTTDKTIVGAINEVYSKTNDIGTLSNLTTENKSNLVAAINEVRLLAEAAGIESVTKTGSKNIPNYGVSETGITISFSDVFSTLVKCSEPTKVSGSYCSIRRYEVDTQNKTCTVYVHNASDTTMSCTVSVTGIGYV